MGLVLLQRLLAPPSISACHCNWAAAMHIRVCNGAIKSVHIQGLRAKTGLGGLMCYLQLHQFCYVWLQSQSACLNFNCALRCDDNHAGWDHVSSDKWQQNDNSAWSCLQAGSTRSTRGSQQIIATLTMMVLMNQMMTVRQTRVQSCYLTPAAHALLPTNQQTMRCCMLQQALEPGNSAAGIILLI